MISSIEKLPNNLSWELLEIPMQEFENWIECVNGSALIQRNGKVTITFIPSDLRTIQLDYDPNIYGDKIHHQNEGIEVKVDGSLLLPNNTLLLKKQVKITATGPVKIYAERTTKWDDDKGRYSQPA